MKRFALTLTIAALFAASASAGFWTPVRCFVHRIVPLKKGCCCQNCQCGNNCKCGVTTPVVPVAAPKCDCPAEMPKDKPAAKKTNEA